MDGLENDPRTRQEYDRQYGFKLSTANGVCDIVFRNSSNGYYGGDLALLNGPLPNSMTSIHSDWSA